MGGPAPIGQSLFNVIVIMMTMCVLMVKSLCQVVMGCTLALECQLLDVRGCQKLRHVPFNIKWSYFPRTPALWSLT
jgi:hypothetical protein